MKHAQETFQVAVSEFNKVWPVDLKPLIGKNISIEDALYIYVQGFYAGSIYRLTDDKGEKA